MGTDELHLGALGSWKLPGHTRHARTKAQHWAWCMPVGVHRYFLPARTSSFRTGACTQRPSGRGMHGPARRSAACSARMWCVGGMFSYSCFCMIPRDHANMAPLQHVCAHIFPQVARDTCMGGGVTVWDFQVGWAILVSRANSKVRPFCCVGFLGDRWLHVGACVARPCVRAALRPFDWRLSKRTAGCTTPRVTRTLRAACCGTPRLGRARLADGGVRGGVRWDLLGVRAEAGQGRRGRFVFWLRVPPGARTMRSATLSLPAGARRTPKAAGHLGQPSVGVRLSPGEPGVQSADCF